MTIETITLPSAQVTGTLTPIWNMMKDNPPTKNGTIAIVLLQDDYLTEVVVQADTWIDEPILPPERSKGRWIQNGTNVAAWIPFPVFP